MVTYGHLVKLALTAHPPPACPGGLGSDEEVAFTALVAQDTLPKLSPARTIRNYLVAQ